MSSRFSHRILSGWTTDLVGRPVDAPGRPPAGIWPAPRLDDDQLPDLISCLGLCAASGYTGQIVWGLFTDRDWSPDGISAEVDERQYARVHAFLNAAESRGLAIYAGIGVLSWGFEAIIRAHPELAPTNNRVLCPCLPESWEWMGRVLDFLAAFGFPGYDLQSADQGRCACERCTARFPTDAEYHAFVIGEVAKQIRTREPNAFLLFDNWGCPFSQEENRSHFVVLAASVDGIIDHDNSAALDASDEHTPPDPVKRTGFIRATSKPYGTLAGCSVWSPRRRASDTYFLPTTVTNVSYLHSLAQDGGTIAMPFAFPWANTSGEISLRFAGIFAQDTTAEAQAVLETVCGETFGIADEKARQEIARAVRAIEDAFLLPDEATDPRELLPRYGSPAVCMISVGGGFEDATDPPSHAYLSALCAPRRERIATEIAHAAALLPAVSPISTRPDRIEAALRELRSVRRDLDVLGGFHPPVEAFG
ncbi:MAG: hypothetical protein H8F28_27810 [Fibrella sp.]|nr:hypothetical protein [Armatimonadota bacterium]